MRKFIFFLALIATSLISRAQFGSQNNISHTTGGSSDVKTYDFDGDGDLDLLSASAGIDGIVWYENFGMGIFGPEKIISIDVDMANSIFAADLDNDGDPDPISSSYYDDKIAWYENLGGGNFGPQQIINISDPDGPGPLNGDANSPCRVYADDLNGDGKIDVLSASGNDDKIAWYENLGGGNFGPQQIITVIADNAIIVCTIDMDNDGDKDVLSASSIDNKIAWYKNLGGGVFGSQQIISSVGIRPESLIAIDINGDGNMDVATATYQDDKIGWYRNLGGGVFGAKQVIATNTNFVSSIYGGDIDGDGLIDLVSSSRSDNSISWYKNLNGVSFGSRQIISSNAGGSTSAFLTDLDNDGDLDAISSSGDDPKIAVYENLGGGIFGSQEVITTYGTLAPYDAISFDMDDDGDNDVLVATANKITWYENLGMGIFDSIQKILSMAGANSLHIEDMDGDGDIDILGTRYVNDEIYWFENLGNGNYSSEKSISNLGVSAMDVYAADLDNDGEKDVIASFQSNDRIAWYKNLGGGIFGSQQVISNVADAASRVFASDLNNDGNLDVISSSWNDLTIAWYRNLGGGTFTSKIVLSSSISLPNEVRGVDIDVDGDIDVLFATQAGGGYIGWFKNLGGGSFSPSQIITSLPNAQSFRTTDMDGDGDLDIVGVGRVVSGYDDRGTIAWNENLGGGVFDTQRIISMDLRNAFSVFTEDIDGDGDPDIISSSFDDGKIAWYENFFNFPIIKGMSYFDENQNAQNDSNEIGLGFNYTTLYPDTLTGYTNTYGHYSYSVDTGTYLVGYVADSLWRLTSDSSTYTVDIIGSSQIVDGLDFGFYPDSIQTRIIADFTGGFPRCNDTINYWLTIKNIGTSQPSGLIHLHLNDTIIFVSSSVVPDSIIDQDLFWSFDSLFFYSSYMIKISVLMPAVLPASNSIASILNVHQLDSFNNIIYSNSDTLNQTVVCAYDPNDKTVLPKGIGSQGFISNNQPLEYLIRFQNTGNDTALTVMVRDQLDNNLDWGSLKPLASSHPMQVWIEQDGEAVFKFNNIMLPDSNVDFLGSQGFVKFSINQNPNLAPNTLIFNTGHIYFDFNPAVITNTALNTIYNCNTVPINIASSTICFGEQIEASCPEGGINNYTWNINSFYTSSVDTLNWVADTVGTFNLTMTTSNTICSKDTTINITILPIIPITNTNYSICQGDSILIYGSYQNMVGIYYDSLQTINGCDSILSTQLVINPLPNVDIAQFLLDTVCGNGGLVTLPIGTPSGGSYSGIGVSSGSFDPSTAGIGTHNVIYTFTDTNSCINSDTTMITVELCTGINGAGNDDFGILIYPNPNTGLFTIEKPKGLNKEIQVKLLDATSKLIIDKLIPIGQQKIGIDISSYSKGIYYLQLIIDNEIFVKQVLKN